MAAPLISLIAAMNEQRIIGYRNQLPWYLPADLARFKKLTWNKPIIMGRKTWQSLPRLLPHRHHIVLSRDPNYQAAGAQVVNDLQSALAAAQNHGSDEIFIIGGAQLYAQSLPWVDRMYLTLVKAEVQGDAYFPAYDETDWRLISQSYHAADARNPYPHRFIILERADEKKNQSGQALGDAKTVPSSGSSG